MQSVSDNSDSKYDSYDSRDDSRYDSYDSRDGSARPPLPREKVGYGIAGLIVAFGGMGVAVVLYALTLFFGELLSSKLKYTQGYGYLFAIFVLVILLLLAVFGLIISLTAAGLGVGGITAGHGQGRRLGVYAVCLAFIPITAVLSIVAWIFANWR